MSINDQLPREVERAARALCEDKHFIGSVWGVLAGYHDLRSMELIEVGVDDARDQLEPVKQAIENLRAAVNRAGDLYPVPPELRQDLKKMENHYGSHAATLDTLTGRQSRNKSLRWLAGSMLNVFDAYGLPSRKLSGFLEMALPIITDTATPSRRAIQTAIKEKRT